MRDLTIHLMDDSGEYVVIQQYSGVASMNAPQELRDILKSLAEDSSSLHVESYALCMINNVSMNKILIDDINDRIYEYDIHYTDKDGNYYYLNYKGKYVGTISPTCGDDYQFMSDI